MTNCSDIERRIKPFLDDLISEEEYQNIHAHLDQCSKCHQYVSAIGSFSYALKELGRVEVPRDLVDTVLFNLTKEPEKQPTTSSGSKKFLIFGVLAAIVSIGVFGFFYFKGRQSAKELIQETSSIAKDTVDESTDSEESAFMSDSEENEQRGTEETDRSSILQELTVTPTEELAPQEMQLEQEGVSLSTVSYHMHFPQIKGVGLDKVDSILSRLDIPRDYRHSRLLIASVPSSIFQQFVSEMELIAPRVLPIRNPDFQKLSLPNQTIRLSVYFEGTGNSQTNSLHWHIEIKSGNEFRIFDLFRQMDLLVNYESPEMIVVTVSSAKIGELISRMESIQGITGDFTSPVSSRSLSSYPIQVSMYLQES